MLAYNLQRRMPSNVVRTASFRTWILLAVAALLALASSAGFASSGTSVVVSASDAAQIGEYGTTSVSVSLAAADTLSEFDVLIVFDSGLIEVEDADAITLNARWDPPTGLPLVIDASTPGRVRVHSSTSDPCFTNPCPLFSVSWVAMASGSATFSVQAQTLAGTQSGSSATLSGVAVVADTASLGQVSTPTTSFTPTPTVTPSFAATSTATRTPVPLATPTANSATAPASGATPASTAGVPASVATPTSTRPAPTRETGSAAPPSSGSGLGGGIGGVGLGDATMAMLLVAALLTLGLVMSSLRGQPAAPRGAVASRAEPPSAPELHGSGMLPPEDVAIAEYLNAMEALGMVSASITDEALDRDRTRQG